MKSLPGKIGNVSMKGKKTKVLSCGCCCASDLRSKEKEKLDKAEIKKVVVRYNRCGEHE